MQKDKKKTVTLILPECSLCVRENRVPQKIEDELKKKKTVKSIRWKTSWSFSL